VAAGLESLPLLIGLLFVVNAFLGLVIPTSMVLALEEHGPIAGMASALGGTLQMVAGGLMIAVTSLFFDGTALPMVATIALCTCGSLVLAALTLRAPREAAQAAE
jgi:DHA1 family bicyclomycin/chloramphenicol resistance-like MFS transporter